MTKVKGAIAVLLVLSASSCDDSKLKTAAPADAGRGGNVGAGGTTIGGSATGGAAGSSTGTGGHNTAATGGSLGTGGRGGPGGSATGGVSGMGGTTACVPPPCQPCLYGVLPNPDPCGCGLCAPPPDGGPGSDAATDACPVLPCPLLLKCEAGYEMVQPTCGCPTCVPVDAGVHDAALCVPRVCPAIACTGATLPNPDPCGCPICAGPDAAPDATKKGCADLDECACVEANGCAPLAEACFCPQCGSTVTCKCAGGKFVGCAPVKVAACEDAKNRVASLCPDLNQASLAAQCDQPDVACVTKCLNEVTSCSDIACGLCMACLCAQDNYTTCMQTCRAMLAAK